jgi:hypothetical protein
MGQRDHAGVLDLSESGVAEARLVGFRINSSELHPLHKTWLDDNIVPILRDGGGAGIWGYASRSGIAAHNLRLSVQRAESVADYVRRKTAMRGPLSTSGDIVGPSLGEYAAALAGQKDGTEDAYYRAVLVRAWRKPAPPPPPPPKPVVPDKRVVVFRRWQKTNYSMPTEPGGTAADLGDAVRDMISPDTGQSRYDNFPSDYAINSVQDDLTVEWEIIAGGSDTTYTREISYTWGPRTDKVHLLKRSRYLQQGDRWKVIKQGFVSRSEIWTHTIAPDAKKAGL